MILQVLTMVFRGRPLFRAKVQKGTRPSTLLNLNEGSAMALQLGSKTPNYGYFEATLNPKP